MTETHSSPESDAATVLVVEDERELADLYATLLRDSYTVRTAYSGEDALSQLDDEIDVALVDRRMPGLSGDDVVEHIRAAALDIRVVIVSAVTPGFDVVGVGFDAYLTKPVDATDLREAVGGLLRYRSDDQQIRELQQLLATKVALESDHSRGELLQRDEYQRLLDRIETIRSNVDDTITTRDDEPIERLIREITADRSGSAGQERDPT